MTTQTHLVTELGKLNVRAQGPATAGIWFETNGSQFPMLGWDDFVVVVLSWWVAAIVRLLRDDSERELVDFMDGPYAVEISKTPFGKFQLRMLAGLRRGRQVTVGEADVSQFVDELSSQSRKLLDECRLRGWWSRDAEELKLHLQNLDRELALCEVI